MLTFLFFRSVIIIIATFVLFDVVQQTCNATAKFYAAEWHYESGAMSTAQFRTKQRLKQHDRLAVQA